MNRHRASMIGTAVFLAAILTALAAPTASRATTSGGADQILVWNQHAYDEVILVAAQAPPVAVLHLAMVHGAIFDAVNAIDGGFQPYLVAPSATGAESKNAAAATAAYQVLLSLFPAREPQLTDHYATSLGSMPDGQAKDAGVAIGTEAASAMILERTNDGRFGSPFFTEGTAAGAWRNLVSPLSPAGNNFKWLGDVDPFLVPDAAMFASAGPLPLGSTAYAAEFQQVKDLGSQTASTRTADQTAMAYFWADHATAMWTRILRDLSKDQDLSIVENARFFAMLYLTTSDAVISCFQDKERWHFWRPQTAIRLAGIDGNPATVADGTWVSLLANPPYPDHPSGLNCFSSSIVQTLRDFFGTNQMSFSATRATSPIGPITRHFTRFSEAIREIRLARVYGGIHFMTADAQGASIGRQVAAFRATHYFQPVP